MDFDFNSIELINVAETCENRDFESGVTVEKAFNIEVLQNSILSQFKENNTFEEPFLSVDFNEVGLEHSKVESGLEKFGDANKDIKSFEIEYSTDDVKVYTIIFKALPQLSFEVLTNEETGYVVAVFKDKMEIKGMFEPKVTAEEVQTQINLFYVYGIQRYIEDLPDNLILAK